MKTAKDYQTEKEIRSYKTQIFALILSIFGVIVTITVLLNLIKIARGEDQNGELQEKVNVASEFVALLTFFIAIYFALIAYKTYRKEENAANLSFLLAAILVFVAAMIKYFEIIKNPDDVTGAEDILF